MREVTFKKQAISIILVAFLLRLPLLNGSLWLDEAAQALESARPLAQQFDIISDFQPPLLHLILHFAQYVSQNEAWMRIWGALIPGLLTIVGTLSIVKKEFSKPVALLTAALLATSSFHVYFSQELRPYALPALWAVFSWYCLTRLLDTSQENTKKTKTLLFVGYGVTTWLGLFSSYLYPFLLLGQGVYVATAGIKKIRPFLITWVITALAYAPWLPTFFKQLAEGQHVRTALPGWEYVVSIPQLKALPLTLGKFIYGVLPIDPTPFVILTALLLGITATILTSSYLYSQKTDLFTKKHLLIISWCIIPLLSSWLISFIVPVVQPKRLLFIQPALYTAVAYLISWGLQQKKKLLQAVAATVVGTLLVVNLFSLSQYYTNPQLQRENWRALHTEITERYPNNSVVVFSFPEPFAPWRWYDTGTYPTFTTGTLYISEAENLEKRVQLLSSYDYILVFDHLRTLTDPHDTLIHSIQNLGYSVVEFIDYPAIGFVRVYAKPEALLSSHIEI